MGIADATGVSVTASTTSPFLTMIDDTLNVGNLPQGYILTCSSAFSAQVANNVEDGTTAQIILNITSNNNTATKVLNVSLKAPKLSVNDITILSSNGNAVFHGGDTVLVTIENENIGHNSVSNATATLSSFYSGATVLVPSTICPFIAVGQSSSVTFEVVLDADIADETLIRLPYSIVSGNYTASSEVFISVGSAAMEDFETGNFSNFNWTQNNNPWILVTSNVYAGTYSAKSKNSLGNSQSSTMTLSLNALAAGNISYYRKVSSENNYDYFTFFIDGVEMESLCGNVAWGLASFPVEAGQHTYKFTYEKDGSQTSGSDCAWIDNISFPPFGTAVTNDIAHLNVTNHTVSNVSFIDDQTIPYNEDATITFNIENDNVATASNVVAEIHASNLSAEDATIQINPTSNNLSDIAANASTTTSFTVKLIPQRTTEFRYVDFNLILNYNGTAVVYPFSLAFEGRNATSIDDNQAVVNFSISPNPVENIMTVTASEMLDLYQIYDMNGKLVKSAAISGNETSINVSSLANGIYTIVVSTSTKQIESRKFIKE